MRVTLSSTTHPLSPIREQTPAAPISERDRVEVMRTNFSPDFSILSDQIVLSNPNTCAYGEVSQALLERASQLVGSTGSVSFKQLSSEAQKILSQHMQSSSSAERTSEPTARTESCPSPRQRPTMISAGTQTAPQRLPSQTSAPSLSTHQIEEVELLATTSHANHKKDLSLLVRAACPLDGKATVFDNLEEASRRLIASNLARLVEDERYCAINTIRNSTHSELLCWLSPKTDAKEILGKKVYKSLFASSLEELDGEKVLETAKADGQTRAELNENLHKAKAIWESKSVSGASRTNKLAVVKEMLAYLSI